jgi:hypothetical protein
MAKSGRYSADRKKVEALAADKTVEVSDCGTCFPAAGGITITLPSAANAGPGWWIRIAKSNGGGAISINDGGETLNGVGLDGDENVNLADAFAIHSSAQKGAWVEIWCDGTQYYAMGMAVHNNGFTA